MRWRSPSKPRCSFAKLVSDRQRVRRSLTCHFQSFEQRAEIRQNQTLMPWSV